MVAVAAQMVGTGCIQCYENYIGPYILPSSASAGPKVARKTCHKTRADTEFEQVATGDIFPQGLICIHALITFICFMKELHANLVPDENSIYKIRLVVCQRKRVSGVSPNNIAKLRTTATNFFLFKSLSGL